ncbi:unnamed protein product, partial [Cylicocyclus nassatus]
EESETIRVSKGKTTLSTEALKRTNAARTSVGILPKAEVPEPPLKSSSDQDFRGGEGKSQVQSQNFMSWFTEKNYINTIIIASGILVVMVIATVCIIGYFVEKNNRKRKEMYKEQMEKEEEKRRRRKRKSHASSKRHKDSEHDEPQLMAKKSAVSPRPDPVKKAVADYLEAQLQTCRLAVDPEKAGGDVGAFQPQNDDYFGNASTPQQAAQTPW